MNKVGFRNFRRFVNFLPIEYKGITFLVGRNNSGKSTLVKALLLVDDFLKSNDVSKFSFSQTNVEDVNIVTYDRARCRNAAGNFIQFEQQYDEIHLELIISGNDDSTSVDVHLFKIHDLANGLIFSVDPQKHFANLISVIEPTTTLNSDDIELLKRLQGIKKELESNRPGKAENLDEYIRVNNELKKVRNNIRKVKTNIEAVNVSGIGFNLSAHYEGNNFKEIFSELIFSFATEYNTQYREIQRGKKPKKIFEHYRAFSENKIKIEKAFAALFGKIDSKSTVYLGASLNKQSALFAIRDKGNPLAQAINEYKQLGISAGEAADRFVKNWMKNDNGFEIGDDFTIKMHAGEAYEVVIKSHGVEIPLADKGMGSIQAMLLLLRLATIIHKSLGDKRTYTIIIEEPELNLHPALQSKLADLFLEVKDKYNINFLIETHSEYILRRSQVLVVNNDFEVGANPNPFFAYYFPKEIMQQPYLMKYNTDGSFKQNFGEGFFDVASSSALELIKLKRQKLA